jgi:chorismate mutase
MSRSSQEFNFRELRKKLSDLTLDILELMDRRRVIALSIQQLKSEHPGFYRFDPERELEIFKHFSAVLANKSIKELLSISLMIEDHAQQGESHSYPAWSSQIHLEGVHSELFGQINPLLLKLVRPDLFSQLPLREEFKAFIK